MDIDHQSHHAEQRVYLFDLIAELAALASGRGDKATAVMLTAVVIAFQ